MQWVPPVQHNNESQAPSLSSIVLYGSSLTRLEYMGAKELHLAPEGNLFPRTCIKFWAFVTGLTWTL